MATYYKLKIEDRLQIGSSSSRSIRRMGKIPINYYYKGEENRNFLIDQKELYQAVRSGQHVFEVSINNETVYVMIKDAQYNPITEKIIHIDLMRVRRTEKMTFSLPLILEGSAIGSVEGGIVTQVSNSIDVECFPTDVPESIAVDISELELNAVLMAKDILLTEDVSLISPEDTTIATCNPPKAEEEPEVEELEEGEEIEEGEEPADGEEGTKPTEEKDDDKKEGPAKEEDAKKSKGDSQD